jgi:hypothetical protein
MSEPLQCVLQMQVKLFKTYTQPASQPASPPSSWQLMMLVVDSPHYYLPQENRVCPCKESNTSSMQAEYEPGEVVGTAT